MKITGIETKGFPSRTAAFRAYFEKHPSATADEAAEHFGCTRHQVWSFQANERRRKEIATKLDDRRRWVHGFAAAVASACRLGHGASAMEVLAAHALSLDDLVAAEVDAVDVEAIRLAVDPASPEAGASDATCASSAT